MSQAAVNSPGTVLSVEAATRFRLARD